MIRRENFRVRAAMVLGALALTACGESKFRGRDLALPPPGEWTAVRCTSCDNAGVSIDVRRSVDENGRAGQHAIARVRNLTGRDLAFTVEVAAAELPDSELYIPSERWRLVLGPSGEARRGDADASPCRRHVSVSAWRRGALAIYPG